MPWTAPRVSVRPSAKVAAPLASAPARLKGIATHGLYSAAVIAMRIVSGITAKPSAT